MRLSQLFTTFHPINQQLAPWWIKLTNTLNQLNGQTHQVLTYKASMILILKLRMLKIKLDQVHNSSLPLPISEITFLLMNTLLSHTPLLSHIRHPPQMLVTVCIGPTTTEDNEKKKNLLRQDFTFLKSFPSLKDENKDE